jgi:hypothetical protein
LKEIPYHKFIELIPVSVLGLEIIEFFQIPFEDCFNRKSPVFKTLLINDEALAQHYKTRSSLLKLLD